MNIEPLGNRVVVKMEEAISKTASGIIIPDAGKVKPTIGEIIAINSDTETEYKVSKGTKLLFGKFSGTEVEIDGKKLLIIDMDEAFAILRE